MIYQVKSMLLPPNYAAVVDIKEKKLFLVTHQLSGEGSKVFDARTFKPLRGNRMHKTGIELLLTDLKSGKLATWNKSPLDDNAWETYLASIKFEPIQL